MLCKCSGKYIDIYFNLKITCSLYFTVLFFFFFFFVIHFLCFFFLSADVSECLSPAFVLLNLTNFSIFLFLVSQDSLLFCFVCLDLTYTPELTCDVCFLWNENQWELYERLRLMLKVQNVSPILPIFFLFFMDAG